MALGSVHASIPLGVLTGVAVGFLLPSLSAYTYKIQNGMNLYNMGFACGLFAMMVVPILTAFGDKPDSALYWSTGHNAELVTVLTVLCAAFILVGFFGSGVPSWAHRAEGENRRAVIGVLGQNEKSGEKFHELGCRAGGEPV